MSPLTHGTAEMKCETCGKFTRILHYVYTVTVRQGPILPGREGVEFSPPKGVCAGCLACAEQGKAFPSPQSGRPLPLT